MHLSFNYCAHPISANSYTYSYHMCWKHGIVSSGAFKIYYTPRVKIIFSTPSPLPPFSPHYSIKPQINQSINQCCVKCYMSFWDKKNWIHTVKLLPLKLLKCCHWGHSPPSPPLNAPLMVSLFYRIIFVR